MKTRKLKAVLLWSDDALNLLRVAHDGKGTIRIPKIGFMPPDVEFVGTDWDGRYQALRVTIWSESFTDIPIGESVPAIPGHVEFVELEVKT